MGHVVLIIFINYEYSKTNKLTNKVIQSVAHIFMRLKECPPLLGFKSRPFRQNKSVPESEKLCKINL